jgi:glycogen debranching enzyme
MHKLNSGPTARDGAYHQGTVWSWLLGPFITAYVGVNGRSEEGRRQAQTWLSPLESHLVEAGLGHISEIFEGDAPHRLADVLLRFGAWPRFYVSTSKM